MEYAKGNVNLINGRDEEGKINHGAGLEKFKTLLQKIKGYGTGKIKPKPKKILIATDADACLFRGCVSPCAGHMGMGVMSDMVYVYRNIFKLCEEANIKCDFCFLTKLQPYQCNPFFKEQLSKRLGKDKYKKPFIKPKDIKFAPSVGGNEEIDHKSFNKKMFDEEGYKDTEVLYFDNDLDYHKIKEFKKNLQSKTQELNATTVFPVNIIHTEDVKNWITEKIVREDIVKKYFEQVWNLNKDKQEQWKKLGGKKAFIEGCIKKDEKSSQFEQKTADSGINFNKDGLKVDELLKATQDVRFDARSELINEQNVWIKQNFETDKELARKLFEKYSEETCKLMFITINKRDEMKGKAICEDLFDKVTKDTFDKIKSDEEIKSILDKYPPEPELDTSVNIEGQAMGNEFFEGVFQKSTMKEPFNTIGNNQVINSISSENRPVTESDTSFNKKEEMVSEIPMEERVNEKSEEEIQRIKEKMQYGQSRLSKNEDVLRLMDEFGNQIATWRDDRNQIHHDVAIMRGSAYEIGGTRIVNERKDTNNRNPSVTRMQIYGENYTFICV